MTVSRRRVFAGRSLIVIAILSLGACGRSDPDCTPSPYVDVELGGMAFRVERTLATTTGDGVRRTTQKQGPGEFRRVFCLSDPARSYAVSGIGVHHDERQALPDEFSALSQPDVNDVALFPGGPIGPPSNVDSYTRDETTGVLRFDGKKGYSLYLTGLDGWDHPIAASCLAGSPAASLGVRCMLVTSYAPSAYLRIWVEDESTHRWVEVLKTSKALFDSMRQTDVRG